MTLVQQYTVFGSIEYGFKGIFPIHLREMMFHLGASLEGDPLGEPLGPPLRGSFGRILLGGSPGGSPGGSTWGDPREGSLGVPPGDSPWGHLWGPPWAWGIFLGGSLCGFPPWDPSAESPRGIGGVIRSRGVWVAEGPTWSLSGGRSSKNELTPPLGLTKSEGKPSANDNVQAGLLKSLPVIQDSFWGGLST